MAYRCRICGNSDNNATYVAREMMYGWRDRHTYFQCGQCDCLQIARVPENLGSYYPPDYLSFGEPELYPKSGFKKYLKKRRTRYFLSRKDLLGRILAGCFGNPILPDWIAAAKVGVDARILDVGCGSGQLLHALHNEGFTHLTGLDPYIEKKILHPNGVRILKGTLEECRGRYDLIMLHHSLEHMADPQAIFRSLKEKTAVGGKILIRLPIVNWAWETFRTDWVQLDAPRHLYLHSLKSLELLAGKHGFLIRDIAYDSTDFQFWGSEQYRRDIPLLDEKSFARGAETSIFTTEMIEEFKTKSAELNRLRLGDQAQFLLVHGHE